MKRIAANNVCSYSDDILAYLYKEMAAADRETFETHLADCGACIDDFAELSQSRYPVFEWKKAEFDPLPTPPIGIPDKAAASISWMQKIRYAFAFRPALGLGAAAAAVFASILTAFILFGGSGSDQEVAREIEPAASPARVVPNVVSTGEATADVRSQEPVPAPYVAPKVVQTSTSNKPAVRAVKPKASQPKKRDEPVPVLSTLDEDEDDSLRLSDIFDEIGTSE